jgi:hypothetical protein
MHHWVEVASYHLAAFFRGAEESAASTPVIFPNFKKFA